MGVVTCIETPVQHQGSNEQIAAAIPLGHLGTPNHIAAAVAFPASEEAGLITGQGAWCQRRLRDVTDTNATELTDPKHMEPT
jgi:NAD(P)-dependent dehydrogenase (short-subunit alcohol dehydrogenase family)